jgi:hypothetical protein
MLLGFWRNRELPRHPLQYLGAAPADRSAAVTLLAWELADEREPEEFPPWAAGQAREIA